jgi:hypothetical protein
MHHNAASKGRWKDFPFGIERCQGKHLIEMDMDNRIERCSVLCMGTSHAVSTKQATPLHYVRAPTRHFSSRARR